MVFVFAKDGGRASIGGNSTVVTLAVLSSGETDKTLASVSGTAGFVRSMYGRMPDERVGSKGVSAGSIR